MAPKLSQPKLSGFFAAPAKTPAQAPTPTAAPEACARAPAPEATEKPTPIQHMSARYTTAPGMPMCKFGTKCYRKNRRHFEQEDHPPDHPLIAGTACCVQTSVTPAKRPLDGGADTGARDASAAGASSSSIGSGGACAPLPEAPSSARSDERVAEPAAAALPTDTYVPGGERAPCHAALASAFLVPVADDAFDLFDAAAAARPDAPCAAFAAAGVTLLGPFRLLAGELPCAAASPLTDRGAHDPPEFTPLARIVGASGSKASDAKTSDATLGYWRDEPTGPPALVLGRPLPARSGPGAAFAPLEETHLIDAVRARVLDAAAAGGPLRAPACEKLASSLERAAAAAGVPLGAERAAGGGKGAAAAEKARKAIAVAPTSNRMGIVVPYDKEADLGYRQLEPSGPKLRKLLDRLVKAEGDTSARASAQAELDELVNWATIANDECDFGASLQLGLDLFNHDASFAGLAARTLATAYSLLDREPYAEIARRHGSERAAQAGSS